MRRVLKPLWVLLAFVFLVEAWLWEHLRPIVSWVVDLIPWRRLKARLADFIRGLPPYATLLVFLVPAVLLLPLKFLGLWLLARGSWLGAAATLGVAKLMGVGVTAFIFDLTRPKLLQLGWFRWLYGHVMVWLERAHALIDPIKEKMRAWIAAQTAAIRQWMRAWSWRLKPGRAGRFFRRAGRIRRRMFTPAE